MVLMAVIKIASSAIQTLGIVFSINPAPEITFLTNINSIPALDTALFSPTTPLSLNFKSAYL